MRGESGKKKEERKKERERERERERESEREKRERPDIVHSVCDRSRIMSNDKLVRVFFFREVFVLFLSA